MFQMGARLDRFTRNETASAADVDMDISSIHKIAYARKHGIMEL